MDRIRCIIGATFHKTIDQEVVRILLIWERQRTDLESQVNEDEGSCPQG